MSVVHVSNAILPPYAHMGYVACTRETHLCIVDEGALNKTSAQSMTDDVFTTNIWILDNCLEASEEIYKYIDTIDLRSL